MKNLEQQFSKNLLTTSRHETRSSKSVKICSDPIPDDVLVDILSRLPRKSIGRFRCVSKLWASILRRFDFTELFLTKSLARPRLLFTVLEIGKFSFYSSPQPQNPDENSSLVATRYHTSLPKYVPSFYCKTVCGLVMLRGFRSKVRVICNPATGEFLTLPKVHLKEKNLPKVKAKSNLDDPKAKEKIAGMYFGYDPIGKQFKVLCMTSSPDERPNTHQVLRLESGKRLWRRIEHKFHFEDNNGRMVGDICINGVLYFGAKFGQSSVIVSFDVGSEKFGFINTDDKMSLEYSYVCRSLTLFNYKGRLGIRHRDVTYENGDYVFYEDGNLVLWVLEDAGNHKWSKHIYVLTPLGKDIVRYNTFVGMTCTGEIVLSGLSNPIHVFFYNLEKNTFTRVNIQGLEEVKYRRIPTFIDYAENLEFIGKKLGIQVPPDGRYMSHTQIAVLEEQKKEVTDIEEDNKVEEDASAVEPSVKKATVEEKPDMNDVPMEDNQVEEKIVRQDLNESTTDQGLNLNANDAGCEF